MKRWLFRLVLILMLGASPGSHTQAVAPVVFVEHGAAITGMVDSTMADEFSVGFPDLTPDEYGNIFVFINSPGGSISEGKLIVGLIEQSDFNIVCVATDEAQSMGFYILQACDVRIAYEGAILMTHEPRIVLPPFFAIDRQMAHVLAEALDGLTVSVNDYCSHRLNITREEYDARVAGHDWEMTPEEALSVGAIDLIVTRPAP